MRISSRALKIDVDLYSWKHIGETGEGGES